MNRFKDIINTEMQNIQLSDDIKMNILNSKYAYKKKRFNLKPLVIALTIVCTVPILTIGVGAVACGGFSEFINGVNILFEPINETCIDNGIKMTVVSAGVDSVENKTVSAYVTVEDITNQNRINKDTTLSTWIKEENNNPNYEHTTMNCQMVSFDDTTSIATYKIVSTIDWWHDFTNKNTFYSNGIGNHETVEKVAEDINLYDLAKDNLDSSFTYYDKNISSSSGYYGCYIYSSSPIRYKSIMENLESIQIDDDIQLTGIGFSDGHLHIKIEYTSNNETNNSNGQHKNISNFKLVDSTGKDVFNTAEYQSIASICDYDTIFYEICFPRINDISKLKDLKLSYNTNIYTFIQGEWNITFKVNDTPQE